jgi:hypothetical protein
VAQQAAIEAPTGSQHFPSLDARAPARETAGNQRPWPADGLGKTLPSVPRLGRSVATVDLSFPSIPDVGCPLLVVRTIGKTDHTKASCFVKAPCARIRWVAASARRCAMQCCRTPQAAPSASLTDRPTSSCSTISTAGPCAARVPSPGCGPPPCGCG